MRALGLAIALAILLGGTGCGSDKNAVMPDVTGKQLDVAKSAIENAGYKGDVKVEGGGVFGVINESNWEVCKQSPAAGQTVSGHPRLSVDRSCDAAAQPSKTSSETSAESSQPHAKQVLTADNSKDLAALLKVSDYCDETVARFVDKYRGRTIEFDGSIKNVATHGDYPSTQYDLLVAPGNKGPKSTVGPEFKFEDVGVSNLNLTGSNPPESVAEGDRFHFVAQVVDYNPDPQCLLFLKPVSTSVR